MRVLRSLLPLVVFTAFAAAAVAGVPAIGSAAPDFQLTTLDGKGFSLSSAAKAHKAVVLIFISTQCPYSNAYNDQMKSLANSYEARRVLFVGVNSNKTEDAADVTAHARAHGHTFPIMKDPNNKVADLYDARRTPEVYVVDSQGKLRYHGRITEDHENPSSTPDLKNALDSFLAGKPIARTETKAFGCTIKRV
jgi:peroxiredoxin